MLKRFFLFGLCALLLAGCKRAPELQPKTATPPQKSKQIRTVDSFSRLVVDGAMMVDVRTGASRPEVILRGAPQDLAQVNVVSQGGTLLIKRATRGVGSVHVEVRSRQLNALQHKGQGLVTGKRIYAKPFDLDVEGQGSVTLNGQIALRRLNAKGDGLVQIRGVRSDYMQAALGGNVRVQLAGVANAASVDAKDASYLSLYWVKGKALQVRATQTAVVQLAGVTGTLDAKIQDKACFKGRHLRANQTFVKTYDQATAEIATLDRQHTLASGASNIYFYNLPKFNSNFMAFNGTVLDMRDWNSPFLKEYDAYNGQSSVA